MSKNTVFSQQLRREIGETQKRRTAFIQSKLTFISALLGLGAITTQAPFATGIVLYLVPLVAFVFDLYIMGEDFSVKRAGVFIRTSPFTAPEERLWESGVESVRDYFSYAAGPLSSGITLVAAVVGIKSLNTSFLPFTYWLMFCLLLVLTVVIYKPIRIKRLKYFEELLNKERSELEKRNNLVHSR